MARMEVFRLFGNRHKIVLTPQRRIIYSILIRISEKISDAAALHLGKIAMLYDRLQDYLLVQIILEMLYGRICVEPNYRMKAMEIVAGTEGVISIATEGEDRNQLVLVGVGIDSATLTTSLRKKIGYTSIISIEKVIEDNEADDEENDDEKDDDDENDEEENKYIYYIPYPALPHPLPSYAVVSYCNSKLPNPWFNW